MAAAAATTAGRARVAASKVGKSRGARELAETGALVSAARNKAPKVKLNTNAAQRPVVTTMTITIGLMFLDAWLIKKEPLPERRQIARLAVLGFVLALMSEITPKLGKSMSYLVLTGVIFERSTAILKELDRNTGTIHNAPGSPGGPPTPGVGQSPLTPKVQPVTLYQRQGPMTVEPLLPKRSRIKRPKAGAAFQI